jgi:hypothetical protein
MSNIRNIWPAGPKVSSGGIAKLTISDDPRPSASWPDLGPRLRGTLGLLEAAEAERIRKPFPNGAMTTDAAVADDRGDGAPEPLEN